MLFDDGEGCAIFNALAPRVVMLSCSPTALMQKEDRDNKGVVRICTAKWVRVAWFSLRFEYPHLAKLAETFHPSRHLLWLGAHVVPAPLDLC
jgi:hypothetical protein